MNKRGIFGFAIILVFLILLLWIWATILPDTIVPIIDNAISVTSGDPHADGVAFFLRMLPWAVPLIFVLGLLWVGANR